MKAATKQNKPRLSGAARRKLAKQVAVSSPPKAGVVMPRVFVGRLETITELRREIVSLYRAARKGTLTSELAARLTYVLNTAAALVKQEQELAAVEQLQKQLAELQGRQPNALHWSNPATTDEEGDEGSRAIESSILNGGGSHG